MAISLQTEHTRLKQHEVYLYEKLQQCIVRKNYLLNMIHNRVLIMSSYIKL